MERSPDGVAMGVSGDAQTVIWCGGHVPCDVGTQPSCVPSPQASSQQRSAGPQHWLR